MTQRYGEKLFGGWKDGSAVRIAYCSSTGPMFHSQDYWLTTALDPWSLILSSAHCTYSIGVKYSHRYIWISIMYYFCFDAYFFWLHMFLLFFFLLFYWIFYLFTFQMLSPFPLSPSQPPYPILSLPTTMRVLPHPPTPISLPWHSPTLGHRAFPGPRAFPATDVQQGHSLLHMLLVPWIPPCVHFGSWFSSWEVCGSGWWILLLFLWVANPFNSFNYFSNSSIGDSMLSSIVGCEHPPLYLPGSGRASQETAILGLCNQALFAIHNGVLVLSLYMDGSPGRAVCTTWGPKYTTPGHIPKGCSKI
jgi:hypothetical protein